MMALDSGTTSNRCILFDHSGKICSVAQKEFTQIFPKPGWVEHDADEIFSTQLEVARQALANVGATARDIAAIGITNQRETTIVWNKYTGRPVYNAIVWQCRRTAPFCERLRAEGLVDTIQDKTGLVIDPYFSATKIHWILEHVPGAREAAEKGFSVAYESAPQLFAKLEKDRFNPDENSHMQVRQLMDCDLLIVDDLGTEMPGNFVTAALYSLVNDRLLSRKATVISTNLNISEIAQRYSPQIASRLQGSFKGLTFVGQDIRVLKNRGL
jgi:glycerol kinase